MFVLALPVVLICDLQEEGAPKPKTARRFRSKCALQPTAHRLQATGGARRRGSKDGKGAFVPEAVASTTTGRPAGVLHIHYIFNLCTIYYIEPQSEGSWRTASFGLPRGGGLFRHFAWATGLGGASAACFWRFASLLAALFPFLPPCQVACILLGPRSGCVKHPPLPLHAGATA